MANFSLISPDEKTTVNIGRILGEVVPRGTFIALDGVLGAGKTQLVKGIACGLDEGGWAGLRSPTFTLMHSYHGGRAVLHHIDFYRLNEEPELPGEVMDAIHSDRAVTVIEWADIWREVWPQKFVHIHIEMDDDNRRRITIEDAHNLLPDLSEQFERYVAEPAET
jgi:tRNA threonylcarbamoyladenosine biosynthesis protein TsaE